VRDPVDTWHLRVTSVVALAIRVGMLETDYTASRRVIVAVSMQTDDVDEVAVCALATAGG
jgi:hypothetical protein